MDGATLPLFQASRLVLVSDRTRQMAVSLNTQRRALWGGVGVSAASLYRESDFESDLEDKEGVDENRKEVTTSWVSNKSKRRETGREGINRKGNTSSHCLAHRILGSSIFIPSYYAPWGKMFCTYLSTYLYTHIHRYTRISTYIHIHMYTLRYLLLNSLLL